MMAEHSARSELQRQFLAAIMATIERVPVSMPPPEGTFTVVDNGTEHRAGDHRVQATFKAGAWVRHNNKPLGFEPTYWVRIK